MLRLFGAPLWTVQQAAQQADIAARCRGRGAEVLAALQAETPAGLEKARKALNGRFTAELYGEGEIDVYKRQEIRIYSPNTSSGIFSHN